jgi:hypothetical protein
MNKIILMSAFMAGFLSSCHFLYSGKSVQDYREKALEGNLIKIYDWNGQLLQEMETDVPCKFLD